MMFVILIFLLMLVVIFALSSVSVLYKYYYSYKKTYDKLSTLTYYLNYSQVYGMEHGKIKLIWFLKDNAYKLDEAYIHSSAFTYFDPYTVYWWMKIKWWCKKNIDVQRLPIYTFESGL